MMVVEMSTIISLLLFAAIPAQAATLSVGPLLTAPTSAVDHAKLGGSFALDLSPFDVDLRATLDVGMRTLSVVNPGAGGNPTAPDQEEDSSGAMPVYATARVLLRTSFLGARPGVGVQSYFTDLKGARAAAVPLAPSAFLDWRFGEGFFTWGAAIALGVQATSFKPLTMIAQPDLSARWHLSPSWFLSVHALGTAVRAFSDPAVTVFYPRAALRLGFLL
jgi:hypothetical protein